MTEQNERYSALLGFNKKRQCISNKVFMGHSTSLQLPSLLLPWPRPFYSDRALTHTSVHTKLNKIKLFIGNYVCITQHNYCLYLKRMRLQTIFNETNIRDQLSKYFIKHLRNIIYGCLHILSNNTDLSLKTTFTSLGAKNIKLEANKDVI